MSAEEDTELRDLVAQSLESNGVLGKIRAQLRASVFLALEEQESVKNKSPFLNKELKEFINTREGRVVTCLVREFLDFFNLDYTKSVFDPETGSSEYYEGRNALSRDLDIIESSTTATQPLLSEVVKRCSAGFSNSKHSQHESDAVLHYDLSPEYLEAARQKFEEYDEDNSGTIDKDELRELFVDVFPDFNQAMLDRYVNDEFRAYDKDFSNSIDFDEFLDMYKRLFVLHKSRVSMEVDEIVHSPRRRQHHAPNTPPPPLNISQSPPPLPLSPPPTLSPTSRKNQPSMGSSVVENMNKKNLTDSLNYSGNDGAHSLSNHFNGGPPRAAVDSPRDTLTNSDNDDSFFDDKPAQNDRIGVTSRDTQKQSNGGSKTPTFEYEESPRPKTPDTDRSGKEIDKKMSDLGITVPEDEPDDQDYDEDFESSKMSSVNKLSGIRTPRSARSDSTIQSIEEDFEIEDDELSGANDLLRSDNSQKDDMTTDRTVSPHDQSEAFDYVEDIAP